MRTKTLLVVSLLAITFLSPVYAQQSGNGSSNSGAATSIDAGGATGVTNGTPSTLLFDNSSSKVAVLAGVANGILVYDGSGNPLASTTAPNGLALGTPASLNLLHATALPLSSGVSGTLPAANLPNPTASTLGGIESLAAVSHRWINTISTSGVPSAAQPATADLSDIGTFSLNTTGGITASGTATIGTIAGSICATSGGQYLYEAGVNCYAGGSSAFSSITSGTNTAAAMVVGAGATFAIASTGTLAISNTALPTPAAGTIGIGGEATVPTFAANGEAALFITSTTGGISLMGKGSTNDFTLYNAAGTAACTIATSTTILSCATFNVTSANAPSNGIYLPSANTLGIVANTTEVGVVTSTAFTVQGEFVVAAQANNTPLESLTGGNLTGSNATTLFNYATTTNTSGVETVWKLAVTNTASGAGALLMNLLAGTSAVTSEFSVGMTGNVVINGTFTAANLSTSGTISGSVCSTSAGLLLYETNGCTIPLNTGSGAQALTAPNNYFVCTTTCTVTPPVPVAGYQFCVRNDDAATTVITLGGNTNIYYEKTNYNGYGTVSGTISSGGALGDKMCIVGRDATHYIVGSFVGTWTAS